MTTIASQPPISTAANESAEMLSPEQQQLKDSLAGIVHAHLFGGDTFNTMVNQETLVSLAGFFGKDASALDGNFADRVRQHPEWSETLENVATVVYQLASDRGLTAAEAAEVKTFLDTDAGKKWNDIDGMVSMANRTALLHLMRAVVSELPDQVKSNSSDAPDSGAVKEA